MFENLTERLTKTIRNLRGIGKLTEENIADALKEVQTALLSADVNFKVANEFIGKVKQDCIGQEVIKSISPGQLIVKIINDNLVTMLGEGTTELSDQKPLRIMMVGLHGSGKTTSSVKLAYFLKKKGYKPGLVACDVYRPAAIDQLEMLAKKEGFPVYTDRETKDVARIGKGASRWAADNGIDALIFDTAGRLQIDTDLIKEIQDLKKLIDPQEVMLVADSALGQEAVNVAKHFHDAVALTGIVLTKLDGDARGGAALSMKVVTGTPIKLIGTGEKMENFEVFHPNRMAQRILGMGDVVSLVEKAQENVDKEESERLAEKVKRAKFDFDDFLGQIAVLKKMGSLSSLAGMIPGMPKVEVGETQEKQLRRIEAIIRSMTVQERRNPKILNGSRRLRIAKGSGVQVKDVNQLIKQFDGMVKMMKSFKGNKGKKMEEQMRKMAESKGMAGLPF